MINTTITEGLFKPKPARESRADATNLAARAIMDNETAAREAKTERLRLVRLAREAAEPIVLPKKKRAPSKRRGLA